MDRLEAHLEHIRSDVVPARGAAQQGLAPDDLAALATRRQPPLLVRGLEQWNAGHFYEQHETLEWLWRATEEPVRDLFKGIILSGVGAYHAGRQNRKGALAKWTGALGYLEPFAGGQPYGIGVGALRAQVAAARQALLEDEQTPPDWEAHAAGLRAFRVPWEPAPAEPAVTALLRRFDRAWLDGGLGLTRHIRGLTKEEARWRHRPEGRTIEEILVHLGVAGEVGANRCFGDAQREFADVTPPTSWKKRQRWLVEVYESVREPLGFLADDDLATRRPMFGRPMRIEQIIDATIEHLLFHAGEISALREIWRLHGEG